MERPALIIGRLSIAIIGRMRLGSGSWTDNTPSVLDIAKGSGLMVSKELGS